MAGKTILKKIIVGSDHGGYILKQILVRDLRSQGYSVQDVGTFSAEPCDYPWIGAQVAEAVSQKKAGWGLLLCKSGAGMAIVANKFPGIRAAVCESVKSAHHAREHNNINILVIGAEQRTPHNARAIMNEWLTTSFGGGRHARRVRQIGKIERMIVCEQRNGSIEQC